MTRDSQNNLEFVRIDETNIDTLSGGLSDLQRSAFGVNIKSSHWRWNYIDNPAGKSCAIVALRSGRVVGKLGVTYMRFVVGDGRGLVGMVEGLSIEPSERSWVCYSGILRKSINERQADDVRFSFGFALSTVRELNKKVGNISLGRVPVYSGFLNTARALEGRSVPTPISLAGYLVQPFVGLSILTALRGGFEFKNVDSFDKSFDEIWGSVEKSRTVAVVKDAAYLNWRYVECPERRHVRLAVYKDDRLEGLVVYRAGPAKNNVLVLELMSRGDDIETMSALLSWALIEMKKDKTGIVFASFSVGSRAQATLKRLGFNSWAARFWDREMMISPGHGKGPSPELELRNWDFSLGDWLCY